MIKPKAKWAEVLNESPLKYRGLNLLIYEEKEKNSALTREVKI